MKTLFMIGSWPTVTPSRPCKPRRTQLSMEKAGAKVEKVEKAHIVLIFVSIVKMDVALSVAQDTWRGEAFKIGVKKREI